MTNDMEKGKYRPSNGTEGEGFMSMFCEQCLNDKTYREKQYGGCDIIALTMGLDVTDEKYPSEWTYDKDGHPTCTLYTPDTPEEVVKKQFFEKRDKNTPDLFGGK